MQLNLLENDPFDKANVDSETVERYRGWFEYVGEVRLLPVLIPLHLYDTTTNNIQSTIGHINRN